MNPDNERAGPCYYCDKIVLEGTGRCSTSNGAIWHKECVGSGRHEGAYHYTNDPAGNSTKRFFNEALGVYGKQHSNTYIDEIKSWTPSKRKTKKKERYMTRNANYQLHITGKKPCFTIWCPDSDRPMRETFDTLEEAWGIADEMASKNDGSRFLVMQSVGYSAVEKPIVRREILATPAEAVKT